MLDIGFIKGNESFRYRAAAIIVEDDSVLFAGNEREDYFYSIGGAVHIGETARDAVVREAFEETGVRYEVDYLAVIHECFFSGESSSLKNLNCHEICLYFMMKPRGTKEVNGDSHTCGGDKEYTRWIPVGDLDKYKAFPTFLKEYLSRKHRGVEHIVTDDRADGLQLA